MLSSLVLALTLAPSPVAYWKTRESRYQDGQIVAVTGPNLMVSGFPQSETVDGETGLRLNDEAAALVYPWTAREKWPSMPRRSFTFSVWFSASSFSGAEGVAACIFQPREGLTGWRLTLRDGKPEFTLANQGSGSRTIGDAVGLSPGKLHRLDASYDGLKTRLYVDGILKATGDASYGDITYNGRAGICLGDWWEGPRSFHFNGFYSRAAFFNEALTPAEVDAGLTATTESPMPSGEGQEQKLLIEPYFQYPTTDSAVVMWKTSRTSPSVVRYGESTAQTRTAEGKPGQIHEVKLTGLKPSTTYFVQVEGSQWASFRTGALPGTPVKFGVVGDTQDHPEDNHRVAAAMFAERPDFAMIVGDLVGMGWQMEQWESDFFASMRPLFSHVPLIPVLGNHERNARIYYDLMSVPAPEWYYTYQTGDVQIWVLDGEHDIRPGSEQYKWLARTLAESKAKWKVVAHHFPPYSSDLDDYGDSEKGPVLGGDLRMRQLAVLYDKYGVDVCFSGHIHSYERSYPLKGGKIVEKGTVYVVVGGGGGDLEQFAPVRQTFSHTVRTGHHFGIVSADSRKFEFRAYDADGRLFDFFTLEK